MNSLLRRLIILTTALLALAAVFVSVRAGLRFEESLTAQRLAGQSEIARSVIDVFHKAVDYNVPFDRIVEGDRYLEAVKFDNPSVDYLIATDLTGKTLYATTPRAEGDGAAIQEALRTWNGRDKAGRIGRFFNVAAPINQRGVQVGWLHVGERANIIEQLLQDIAFDILTVLTVATIVAFELLRPLLAASFSTPLRALQDIFARTASGDFRRYLPRDYFGGIGRLNSGVNAIIYTVNIRACGVLNAGGKTPDGLTFDQATERAVLPVNSVENIRWPFFLLIFSESLSLAFFPVFVGNFFDPSTGIPRNIAIGLPITVFMLVWALSMPYAGACCDRFGYRLTFGVGALITTIGLVLTAYSFSMIDLILWRSITAVGYGIVYVTSQAYITTHVPPAERTRGQAMFLASFFAGSLSGAAIGGILVDRLGFKTTFILSGALSALAAIYVLRFLGKEVVPAAARKGTSMADFTLLLKHKQFAAITFFSAIPAKVALAGFLYYSVPLYLKGLGYSQSLTGRVMMAYGLAIILIGPLVAQFADRIKDRLYFVMFGGYAAAFAMALPLLLKGIFGATLAVIGLGVAHAIGVSAQMTLINDRCGPTVREVGQAKMVGIFRLVERTGSIAGPVLLGAMIALSDFLSAFALISGFMLITTTIFSLLLFWSGKDASKAQTTQV